MLTVTGLKIEGFRGFPKAAKFTFDCPVTLLLAENHQGKSSVMNAIEWCLFGDDCVGKDTGLRERIGWEVVNRESGTARVELRLEDPNGKWVVERSQRQSGKKTQTVALTRPDGTKVEGSGATQQLASLIGLNYRDFFCTAYQHQESVRGVLVQEPRERNDAIDRLLGLSDYRNVIEALRQAKAPDLQEAMSRKRVAFREQVDAALRERRKDLEEKRGEWEKHGLTDAYFNEKEAMDRGKALARDIEGFAAEMILPSPVFTQIEDWRGVKPFCAAAETALESLLRQASEIGTQQDLLAARDCILRAKAACEGARNAAEVASCRVQAFAASTGNRDALGSKTASVKHRIAELDAQIRATTPKAKLVQEGITLLESSGLGTGKELCPLCGNEVENLLAHLKAEWEHQLEQQIANLQTARKQHEDELRGLGEKIGQLTNLERESGSAKDTQNRAFAAAGGALGLALSASDDPVALCNQRIDDINAALEKISAAMSSRQQRFEPVRAGLAALLAIYDVLALHARIDALGSVSACEEFKQVEHLQNQMATLVADVGAIQAAVRDASTEVANLKITAAQGAVQKYFVALAANPGMQHVELKVVQKANGNDYRVLDSSGNEVTPILSQGDLNCLALAMFFGLAEARGEAQGLSLMMLDDPSQSLGEGHLRRLVQVLNQITTARPTVLATMDPAFGQMLRRDLLKAKTIYELRDWTPEQGPQITGGGALAGLAA